MTFDFDIQIVAQGLKKFYDDSVSNKKQVINQQKLKDIISALNLEGYTSRGGLTGENLSTFLKKYLSYSTRLHHPLYLGHQCAAPHYSSALGAFINSFTNNVANVYEMGPASASIEYFLVNWMLGKIGWKKSPTQIDETYYDSKFGGGVFVDGGSIANLTALIIARSKIAPDVWKNGNPSNLAILLPQESHYSLSKAAGILGIGENSIYALDIDNNGAIIPDKIENTYKKLIKDGKKPIALVANACSTSVGIYDPLEEIADFCNKNEIWFHVDGAHGASALVSDKYKGLLKGVNKADSLTWDAHKLLQVPSLCAALLVRDHRYLDQGIHQEASYLFHEKIQPGFDLIQRTIETTKSGLGEKLFFVLGAIGEKGLADFIEDRYQLTEEAYFYINQLEDFECPVHPQSNILCFRIEGEDKTQIEIRNQMSTEGSYYFTTAMFNNKRYLRLVFMSPNTTLSNIKQLVTKIRKIKSSINEEAKVCC
ncbi:MAG: aminotransferase class I/II-fold pyridoxal phosphate-dependent enzyme [Calditrichaeota bacterium]|nr:MAG: aminotransferase class I/II-fold pyridoxal phosphate-dependent enzyme [Calditrichota bacterium]MBL1207258.1 aminotransferase class I/II-fold pyridoxal phosphate-dependent enzyme [Calditrichota bacterium]NOG47091.1 aminotransferase class I/II-fold pyridoxal phosphate-dependent enzyme [Calditrichota bacterium]